MKFKNFRNSFNNSNRIYSEDDIMNMTLQTLFDKEHDVLAQNREIGVPTLDELKNSQNTQWVEPFVDNEGKNDGGYWQSIMEDRTPQYNTIESLVPTNNDTQSNINLKEPTVLKGGVEYNYNKPNSYIENLPSKNANLAFNTLLLQTLAKNPMYKTALNTINTLDKYNGLTPKAAAQKAIAKNLPDVHLSEKEFYEHGLKLADGEEPTEFMKQNNDFFKLNDITDKNLKKMYIDKLSQMYKKDMSLPENYELIKNFDIVVPKENSQLHSQIKNSETFQKWVAENYNNIQNNTNKNKSLIFPIVWDNDNAQRSLGLTLHKTDMSNAKVHEDGSFSVFPTDIPDYDHLESKAFELPNVNDKGEKLRIEDKVNELFKILGYNFVVDINNNALQQQEKNKYLKYLLSTQIKLSKKEVDEILKKYKFSR